MIKLVRYHTMDPVPGFPGRFYSQVRVALVKVGGRKWLHVVAIDATAKAGMRRSKVPLTEERYMSPVLRKGQPYPMRRALKTFRSFAKVHGWTKAAKKIVKEASKEC